MRHGVRGCRDGGVAERHEAEQGRSEDGVRAQVGWGVSGARPGSRAASGAAAQRGTRGALDCLRARAEQRGEGQREREREEREREWRETTKVNGLTWSKLTIFN